MKKILYTIAGLLAGCILSCTPDKYDVAKIGMTDMSSIKEIKLRTNHFQVLANGKAQLEFCPLLITNDGFEVQDSRVDHSQLEYYTLSGVSLSKTYTTSDKSLIGQEINAYAKIKGRDIISNTVSFSVVDPSAMDTYTEITIPIVFHLIQSNNDIIEYGGEIPLERINLLIDKINNTFSGAVSQNATGVDTKIRFKAAVYDPSGNKLREPGINRIRVEKVSDEAGDQYKTLIANEKALWPYDKYLNVWLISDRDNEYTSFHSTISTQCVPRYIYQGTDLTGKPEGLELSTRPADREPIANEIGILYKIQSLQTMVRTFVKSDNELINCFGFYFGLLPTWETYIFFGYPEDYCSDTHKYCGYDVDGYQNNMTQYKLVGNCYFLAENIMDDPVGVHRSISLQQCQRIRWILNNCPERSAWKSDFAFTGQ
ncbi:hypothetical protein AALK14_13965 [Butyricimonas hominis]|uniref:hypothetical protein n=1 Tax=Butyricimonas TaxID=574697 RepID=UPI00351936E4